MNLHRLLVALFVTLSLPAAEADVDKERWERVRVEVERRKLLREQAATTLENARRVVREHESGTKKATEAELAAARALIQPAPSDPRLAAGAHVSLSLPAADMKTVTDVWQRLFGGTISVTDRAKSRTVHVVIHQTPIEEIRPIIMAALRATGIYVIERPNGVVFDTQPESKASK